MKRGREIRNLPVIDVESGDHLGVVQELKMGRDYQVEGLYYISPEQESLYLPLNKVIQIGRDAVLAEGNAVLPKEVHPPDLEEVQYEGSWVMTDSGKSLGTVEDIVIEEEQGKIVGYEISDGYLKDLLTGRKMIAVSDVLTFGNDTVIVKENYLE